MMLKFIQFSMFSLHSMVNFWEFRAEFFIQNRGPTTDRSLVTKPSPANRRPFRLRRRTETVIVFSARAQNAARPFYCFRRRCPTGLPDFWRVSRAS